jgi:hypothetical protein
MLFLQAPEPAEEKLHPQVTQPGPVTATKDLNAEFTEVSPRAQRKG